VFEGHARPVWSFPLAGEDLRDDAPDELDDRLAALVAMRSDPPTCSAFNQEDEVVAFSYSDPIPIDVLPKNPTPCLWTSFEQEVLSRLQFQIYGNKAKINKSDGRILLLTKTDLGVTGELQTEDQDLIRSSTGPFAALLYHFGWYNLD